MAVSVQARFSSNPGMWNLEDLPTAFPATGVDSISNSLAYQYPMATSTFEPSNLISIFQHPPLGHSQPLPTTQEQPASPGIKDLEPSTNPRSAKIKRSMSTPNVRGQAAADAAALALSADKRRNKLGYHRTSVACGHCRRRKIRCIPAPADPQNRCSNCIRLKKECNFYPVDQHPQPDPRRRDSRNQNGPGGPSQSSSPTASSSHIPEIPSNLPYPPLNMPPIQDLGGPQMKRQRTESFSPENKDVKTLNPGSNYPDKVAVVTSSRNFDYNHGATNWMAPDASPSIKHQTEVPQSYWRGNPQDSPLTPAFSPFTPGLQIPPPQNWPAPQTEPSPRDDLSWSVPQRSMSYGNLEEGLQGHQQYASYTQAPPNPVADHYTTKPRVHGMYPPPLATQSSAMIPPTASTTAHETLPHPHSAGSLSQAGYQSWQHPYSYQKPASSSSEGYGSWNAPHEALPRSQAFSGDVHGPAQTYGYGEPTTGMYYSGSQHPPPSGHQNR